MTTSKLHPSEACYFNEIAIHHGWHYAADCAVLHLAKKGEPFSVDDVRELLKDAQPPTNPNAWGGLFMAHSRRGTIVRCGGGTSRTPARHGGHRHVWMGTPGIVGAP